VNARLVSGLEVGKSAGMELFPSFLRLFAFPLCPFPIQLQSLEHCELTGGLVYGVVSVENHAPRETIFTCIVIHIGTVTYRYAISQTEKWWYGFEPTMEVLICHTVSYHPISSPSWRG